ncbi:MAG: YggS family pyridoxal phosphate-dependent enzyme [Lachnospiraceae bacterium]|nr:YggS family pyridoxal phosphate-dependent enzyme [Candidatus Merdinaster equi]
MISENIKDVHQKINDAAKKAGRNSADITLCAVSKTKPLSDILECMRCGENVFGENYVQEIVAKCEELEQLNQSENGKDSVDVSGISIHMIGHLQTNKVKYIIDKVDMIHSVDSIKLALEIEKQAVKKNLEMDVLLEVNIADEESKWGFGADEVRAAIEEIKNTCPHVKIRGFMTSAPYTEDPETNRIHFRNLKGLFDELKKENPLLDTLSMGMTGDYQVAVEEGATIVRVGTGIFGARDYSH